MPAPATGHRPSSTSVAAPGVTRRGLLGSAMAAGGTALLPAAARAQERTESRVDVLLIGGGIMSATLGVLLRQLEPGWTMELVERLDRVAGESSDGWNNAGTGHSALCELNYTPVAADGLVEITKAIEINEQWQVTRQFLSHQVRTGVLRDPRAFINSTPHMNLVWGDENVAYLKRRYDALGASPLFSGMEFTTDPRQIAQWVPLMTEGRAAGTKLAATRSALGTDCDWGEVTRQYIASLAAQDGVTLTTGYEVRRLERSGDGGWRVTAEPTHGNGGTRVINARFVFAGAGGGALPILQESGIPEADNYAGFPVGGSFLVTQNPQVAGRHLAKVYGKAAVGSPPMSVPHLDTRYFDKKRALLFGPFATFSTKFLKNGSYFDLPASVTLDNFRPMVAVGWDNFELVEYLAGQLMMSDEDRLAALREYLPNARAADWKLWQAGQRVQIIKRDPQKGGVLKLGTEVVASRDGSIAALLGASPGASTAPSIMLGLLKKVFPQRLATPAWQARLREIVPTYGVALNDEPELLAHAWAATGETLKLAAPPPTLHLATRPRPAATRVKVDRHPDLAL